MIRKSKWNLKTVSEIALLYNTRFEFQRNEYGPYKWALRNKKLDKVCFHMNKKEHIDRTKWNFKLVQKEAKKYKTRYKFQRGSSGAYHWSYKHGFYEEITKHMTKVIKWDYNSVKEEASKYIKAGDFKEFSRGAYNWAKRKNILNDIGSHFIISSGFNSRELAILYYIRIEKDGDIVYKIGITNNNVKKRFQDEYKYITEIMIKEYKTGQEALDMEQSILRDYSYAKYQGEAILRSGNTEMFNYDILNLDEEYKPNEYRFINGEWKKIK